MATPRKITVRTKVDNGKLIYNRDKIEEAVKTYEGKNVTVTVERWFPKRSLNQNNYYWGVIIEHWLNIINTEWGEIWTSENMHEFLKVNLNYEEYVDVETGEIICNESTGKPITKPKSTTDNTTLDQEQYHEACRQLAFQMFNYTIPLPNEEVEVKH